MKEKNVPQLRNKRILFMLFVVVLTILFFGIYKFTNKNSVPEPVQGVLDLRGWNINDARPRLNGEWEFYWNQLLTYQDFSKQVENEKQLVVVPKTWNEYTKNDKHLSGYGYATYRLKVIVDNPQEKLSLRLDNMSTAYRLYINETELASNGTVGNDSATSIPGCSPEIVEFTPPAKEFYIIVQVSNYTYARGGIWYEIDFGTVEQIQNLNIFIIYKDALLIGSLLIMALFYTGFYYTLQKDKSSWYFILLCLIFIIRTSIYGDFLLHRLIYNIPYRLLIFLTYVTLYWIPVIIYLMIESIYGIHKKFHMNQIVTGYGILMTLLTAILPIHLYTSLVSYFEIIGILLILLSVIIVMRAFLLEDIRAGLILIAISIILITGIHDVMYQANLVNSSYGELASAGIFIFMFIFSFIIAGRLSDAYEQSKNLYSRLVFSMEKERESALELMTTELSFLKAQIRPHFIYNSLSTIAALTLEQPAKAKELLYNLTDYLRGSFQFDNNNGLISLDQELETVKAYLAIETARFPDKIKVEYNLESILSIKLPILTLQPLVENSVRHGILKKDGSGTIKISTYDYLSFITIEIEDDGVGITADKLDSLLQSNGSTKGVGIKNINRRLLLFYGTGLEIESAIDSGTRIRIKIPREGNIL